jgi:nucleolar protein 16
MANPRQRRKSRSGTAKVSTSKQSRKNKHKVVVKGPEVLVENWDRTYVLLTLLLVLPADPNLLCLTVRPFAKSEDSLAPKTRKSVEAALQNTELTAFPYYSYAKLGLLPKLNPRQAGGIEPVEALPYAVRSATAATMADLEALSDADSEEEEEEDDEEEEEEDTPMASTSTAEPTGSATLAKGLGRIIRDENGKVIKIVLGGDDGQEVEEEVKERVERDSDEEDDDDESDEEEEEPKPWGEPMKDWSNDNVEFEEEEVLGPRTTGQGIPIFGGVRRSVEAKTDVVRGESSSLPFAVRTS